jgi:hypothetical protein
MFIDEIIPESVKLSARPESGGLAESFTDSGT